MREARGRAYDTRHGEQAWGRRILGTFALDIVAPARGVAGRVVGRSGYRRRSVYARWIRLLRVRVRPDGPYALESGLCAYPPRSCTASGREYFQGSYK